VCWWVIGPGIAKRCEIESSYYSEECSHFPESHMFGFWYNGVQWYTSRTFPWQALGWTPAEISFLQKVLSPWQGAFIILRKDHCLSAWNSSALTQVIIKITAVYLPVKRVNPVNPELNSICYLLALLAHHFLHDSRIRVKSLTLRLLMSYIYIYIYSAYSWCF